MKSFRKRLSFARRPGAGASVTVTPSSSAHPWEEDRERVLNVGASFAVKYLASTDVPQPRGVGVCENAVRSIPYRKGKKRMTLTISKDGIRIVEDATKMLAVDQPINKISFCSPDPYNPRIFSYIARDGVTRRWICHVFVAVKGITGERLSHALGCAFAACLRDKQKNEENLQKMLMDESTTVQLENMVKDSVTPQVNVHLLRQQHQTRRQNSSSVSPSFDSSANSSPDSKARAAEDWQEKADSISFEEELDSIVNNRDTWPDRRPDLSLSISQSPSLTSNSFEVDFDEVKTTTAGPYTPQDTIDHSSGGQRASANFRTLPGKQTSAADMSSSWNRQQQQQSHKRRSLGSPATNDPWQSVTSAAAKSAASSAANGQSSRSNAARTGNALPQQSNNTIMGIAVSARSGDASSSIPPSTGVSAGTVVTLDPWSASAIARPTSQTDAVPLHPTVPSTNPWASEVVMLSTANSIGTSPSSPQPQATTYNSNNNHSDNGGVAKRSSTDLNLFDPLHSSTWPEVGSTAGQQQGPTATDPNLFGDWGVAVKQMYQTTPPPQPPLASGPTYGRQTNPWGVQPAWPTATDMTSSSPGNNNNSSNAFATIPSLI